jgi:hypothetical protein
MAEGLLGAIEVLPDEADDQKVVWVCHGGAMTMDMSPSIEAAAAAAGLEAPYWAAWGKRRGILAFQVGADRRAAEQAFEAEPRFFETG